MKPLSIVLAATLGLAACGGGARFQGSSAPTAQFATGPIQQACQAQGRKQASRARCGCIQAVADWTLSAQDQRRGASYFNDPHGLQEVRQDQDSNPSNKRFWAAWKAYGQQAAEFCQAT